MLSAFLIPVLDGTPVNLADTWDPALALRLMSTDGLVVGGGPPISQQLACASLAAHRRQAEGAVALKEERRAACPQQPRC